MPRPNRPWYRADRGEWYMTIDGVKTRLRVFDPDDEAGATAAARRLCRAGPRGEPVVRDEVGRFEREVMPSRAAATRVSYAARLGWVVRHWGDEPVSGVTAAAVAGLAAGEPWSDGTRRLTLTVAKVFFRWAGRADFAPPLPPWGARDERCVVSADELAAAINLCRGDFAPLVNWLFLTGCRPKEGRTLTAAMVDLKAGRVTIDDHKTRHKTRRPKTVYLSEAAADVLRGQLARYGSGHLFRRPDGRPFSAASVQVRWRRVRDALGLRAQVVTYGLRHSFATHLLEGGASSRDVAELLGHTSTVMVEKVYGHFTNVNRLREVAGRLTAKPAT